MDAKKQNALNYIRAAMIIMDAIREAGEDGIPSGHIYAVVMGKMDLTVYQSIIDFLVDRKFITCQHHLLKAIP